MHKKGFTLIELLAVIVILAIIALITMPLITKVVEKVRLGAVRDSVYNLIDAAELQYVTSTDIVDDNLTFTCDGKKCVTSSGAELKFKGKVPVGEITANKNNSNVFNLVFGDYCAFGDKKDLTVVKGGCKAGIYDNKNNLLISWDDLANKYHFDIEKDYDEYVNGDETSLYNILLKWSIDEGKELTLMKMIIPEGVTRIGNYAFKDAGFTHNGCHDFDKSSGFTNVYFPSTLKTVGRGAFYYQVNLDKIVLPEGVTKIEDYAFSLTFWRKGGAVYLPDSLETIGNQAFYVMSQDVKFYVNETTKLNISFDFSRNYLNGNKIIYNGYDLTNRVLKNNFIYNDPYFYAANECYKCEDLDVIEVPESTQVISSNTFSGENNIRKIIFSHFMGNIMQKDSFLDKLNKLETIEVKGNVDEIKSIDGNLYYILKDDTNNQVGYMLVYPPKAKKNVVIDKDAIQIYDSAFNSLKQQKSITFENPNGWVKKYQSSNCQSNNCDYKTFDIDFSNPNNNPRIFNDTFNLDGYRFVGIMKK